jgi:IMP dehydrogenase
LVIDSSNKLKGIVTKKDLHYYDTVLSQQKSKKTLIEDIMTPLSKMVYAQNPINIEEVTKLMFQNRKEKIPIINECGTIHGLLTAKDIMYKKKFDNFSILDRNGQLRVGAAIGVSGDYYERAIKLINVGCDVLVIDVAHGHHSLCGNAIKEIKKNYNIDIIAGNVCTEEGIEYLHKMGADAIKVGVGPGSICTTRIQTGCGYPQFSAVYNCGQKAKELGIPIIADGGHRGKIGNIVKALAAGASCSMLGGMISGTTETPGKLIIKNNKKYKMIRGMAGRMSNSNKNDKNNENTDIEKMTPEGVEGYVNYKGDLYGIIEQMKGGMRSGLSYCGVDSIYNLHKKEIQFLKISGASKDESNSHDIKEI